MTGIHPPSTTNTATTPGSSSRATSLIKNAMKRKHSFIQFFAMTGILLLSMRSLGQKYRLHELREDNYALEEEHKSLVERMESIRKRLLHEAAMDGSGAFGLRLRSMFGGEGEH
ncbi:hypothetical protein Droror1_Dr00023697 [Drosera rotundifolia]